MRRALVGAAVGTLLLAGVAGAAGATKSQRVRATRGPVLSLAADGDRAAFIVEGRVKECWSVMVWEPARGRAHRLQSAAACERNDRPNRRGTPIVTLAGSRAAWLQFSGGNTLETIVYTATLARPTRVLLAMGIANDGVVGYFARRPFGDGSLLAFALDKNCSPDYDAFPCPPARKPGEVVESTVWRVTGGRGPCRLGSRECSVVTAAEKELALLAVDAGRLAVRTDDGISLITSSGRVLLELPGKPRGAALSGNRLALRMPEGVEVYDTRSGDLVARVPVADATKLADLQGQILVTTSGTTVTLRWLGTDGAVKIRARGAVIAQLEPSGLFVAAARRVTFTPMRDVLRLFAQARGSATGVRRSQ